MALASSFKIAFESTYPSLDVAILNYRLSNRNLYFKVGVPICCWPI